MGISAEDFIAEAQIFAIYTPFKPEEVRTVLNLSLEDYEKAVQAEALSASVVHIEDPFKRIRLHSFWDVLTFVVILNAGWPRSSVTDLLETTSSIIDDVHHIYLSEYANASRWGHPPNTMITFKGFGLNSFDGNQTQWDSTFYPHLERMAADQFYFLFHSFWLLATTGEISENSSATYPLFYD